MRAILIFLFFALLSCRETVKVITPAVLTNNLMQSKLDSTVQTVFNNNLEELDSPGISIGILKDGKSHFYGYGETTVGNGIIPDENTIFEIGSITKTFTAIAIAEMLLNEKKNISIPVKNYLPSGLPTLQRGGIEVNFKHLLTHSSGLPRMPNNFFSYQTYSNDKLYQYLYNVQLESVPFTKFNYSNTGFGILGNILEMHYRTSYNDLISNRLLAPLHLDNTKVNFDDIDISRWATGYKNGRQADYWKSLNSLNGAGVLKSNAKDLLLYAEANLTPPNNTLGRAILLTHQKSYSDDYEEEGLAWAFLKPVGNTDKRILWHNGSTGGFNSWLYINRNNNSALVILFNSSTDTNQRIKFISELRSIITQ